MSLYKFIIENYPEQLDAYPRSRFVRQLARFIREHKAQIDDLVKGDE